MSLCSVQVSGGDEEEDENVEKDGWDLAIGLGSIQC